MKKIHVRLKDRGYNVCAGSGALRALEGIVDGISFSGPLVVITDRTVWGKLSKKINPYLKSLPNEIIFIFVPSGEKAKSLRVFMKVVQSLSKRTRGYRPLVVALGGGVIGDLAGFVAATYRRGVSLLQMPTTLLAQVDSSIGGKVAVDIPEAKNMVGTFYQPKAVLTDTDLLDTLPKKEIRNGLAEMIKYGVISDTGFFSFLEKNVDGIMALEKNIISEGVLRCARIKARVVESDEFDQKDIRIILNFGHTLGHAVESASGYQGYTHGEAVAIGMVMAGQIALEMGYLGAQHLKRIVELLERVSLPTKAEDLLSEDIIKSYYFDKKFISGKNRFVLPEKIGKVVIAENIPLELIKKVVKNYAKK